MFTTEELDEKIDKILKIQEKNIKKNKSVHGLIILDDVALHSKSKKLVDLSSKGRHYLISVIFSC